MSIKRTKQTGPRRPSRSSEPFRGFGPAAPPEKVPTWQEDVAGQPEESFQAYSMAGHFAKGVLLNHPVFGKGLVIGVEDRKISVLFADGTKTLGHTPR